MPEKNSISFKRVLLIFLLIFGVFWRQCDSQVMREEANKPPGDTREKAAEGRLRGLLLPGLHVLQPPLWCNWTIQVAPAKRIDLHLEDLTPDDACHLKDDQKCWKEAKYTSSSNTLYVVLLIGGWPTPPYRGFYGRYQAFGPPVVYNPQEGLPETNMGSQSLPSGLLELNELLDPNPDLIYSQLKAAPTVESSTQVTSRWGREASQTPSDPSDSSVPPHQEEEGQNREEEGQSQEEEAAVEEASTHPEEATAAEKEKSADDKSRKEVIEASDQLPVSSEEPEPEPEETHPHPNMVEPLSDQRAHPRIRNHSDISHLPGGYKHHMLTLSFGALTDYLFEVAVEVNFSPEVEESWDILAIKQLETLHTPLSMSSERIKRLSAGALFIVWLQLDQGPGGLQVHRTLHSALQGLLSTHVGVRGNRRKAVILSVSTADVDECVSQLVRCDLNADCENRFGSYSCRCRSGFQDESRLGSAGTVCVNRNAAGCSSSSESRGVYVLFFLLSSVLLLLLGAGGLLYLRHHRGAFLLRGHAEPNNNTTTPTPTTIMLTLSCPPHPSCPGFRDVPLQRFSSLLPGGHGGKM
ncbi:hypothetical protein F7725_006042 [Dissostichus mawsoni]|uniref:EGF-like domain-containing protein n=1 Tax=Dissostichus mawsoni TaxID=36200 RepID=A0A7J5YW07_DISMA|nr:hypothetical protein F7725_006042 [Dissostichus mawsoni]